MGLACRAVQNVLCFLVGCVISNNFSSLGGAGAMHCRRRMRLACGTTEQRLAAGMQQGLQMT